MNFPSNILSIFGFMGGTQNPMDATVYVPALIQPSLEIPTAVMTCQQGVLGDEVMRRVSFSQSNIVSIDAAAAVDDFIFVLAPGLWDLAFNVMSLSNHTTFTKRSSLYFAVGAPGAAFLWNSYAIANVPQHGSFKVRVSVGDASGMPFLVQVPVQGAGESTRFAVAVVANRMG